MADNILKGLAAGAVAGLAASWVMNQAQSAFSSGNGSQSSGEPATVKAAERIAEPVLNRPLTDEEKPVAGPAMHYGFGTLSGAIYGAGAEKLPAATAGAGLLFGTTLWLVADEAAVPALGLSGPPAEQPASTHAYALASHLVYGLTAEIVRRAVRRLL